MVAAQIGPKGACALCFQNGAPDDTIVLGTNFLRAFYSTYTYNSTSRSSYISLAPSAQGTPASKRGLSIFLPGQCLLMAVLTSPCLLTFSLPFYF